jgi:hypothetical protein
LNFFLFYFLKPLKLTTSKSDKATLTSSFSLNNIPSQQTKSNLLKSSQQNLIENDLDENEFRKLNKSNNVTRHLDDDVVSTNQNNNKNNKSKIKTSKNTSSTQSMASMSVSSSSSTTTSSPILENYLLDLKRVIEWLVASENQLSTQADIGADVNSVKQQFQTHEDFMLDLTKHQNNVGLVLQEGSRLINTGGVSGDDESEIRKQMKLLNDMWENLRLQAVERQAKLHERLMKVYYVLFYDEILHITRLRRE